MISINGHTTHRKFNYMNVIIGIGDSWTAGVGGIPDRHRPANYPNEKEYFYYYGHDDENIPNIVKQELESSWVNQLALKLDFTAINLGISGGGNRAAVKSLYVNDIPWNKIQKGILIFLLSSRSRFDVFNNDIEYAKNYKRRFCNTIDYSDEDSKNFKSRNWWLENFHSDILDNTETILNILEAQTIADSHNLDFYFGFSFDDCSDLINIPLAQKINWNRCFTKNTSLLKILASKQNTTFNLEWYFQQEKSTQLISKCCHPTDEGYKLISNLINDFIKSNDQKN